MYNYVNVSIFSVASLQNIPLGEHFPGGSPLHNAVEKNNVHQIEVLVANGAIMDATDADLQTPLHYAAMNGNFEAAVILLDHDAEVNSQDVWGETPLYYALESENLVLIRLLLMRGADPNIPNKQGQTPMTDLDKEMFNFVKSVIEESTH